MTREEPPRNRDRAVGASATTTLSQLGRAQRSTGARGGVLLGGALVFLGAACPREPWVTVDAGRDVAAGETAKGDLEQSGCTCSGTTSMATLPLACGCSGGPKGTGGCPADVDEVQTRLRHCSSTSVVRIEACGKVALRVSIYQMIGTEYVFDATTGRLIGVKTVSDASAGPCRAFSYQYGEAICASTKVCTWCGQTEYPTCWSNADAGADAAGDVSADR
jgi:hypothetical protein